MKKIVSKYKVRMDDINYGGHMGNEKALQVFNDARVYYLKQLGSSELNIGGGVGVIIAESNIKYIKEVLLHDILETEVWISDVSGLKWTISYKTKRKRDDKVVFIGTTIMICYDYNRKKVVKIPEDFLKKVKK